MEWYLWVVIGLGFVVIGILKMKVWRMLQSRKNNKMIDDEDMD